MKPAGRQESAYPIAKSHEYILCYSRNEDSATLYNIGAGFDDKRNDEFRLTLLRKGGSCSSRKDRPKMFYPIYYNKRTNSIYTNKTNDVDEEEILPIKTDNTEGRWRWQKSNVENNINMLVCKKNNKGKYEIYTKDFIVKDGYIKGNKANTFIVDKEIINSKAKDHLGDLFGDKEIFSYPKSEFLLQRIIELTTQENDLVMDFFAGSGTTLAVAHKMNRRWVGIEQMEYIESITKERLKKVVSGEQGGISKAVGWSGGGGFIYAELMPLNAVYKERILSLRGEAQAFHNQKVDSSVDCHDFATAKSRNDKKLDSMDCHESDFSRNDKIEKELMSIYKDLCQKAFLDYRVDVKKLDDEEFSALSFEEKCKILYAILDSNMDYVPYADMEDSEYGVSDELRELNRIFYGEEE